MLASDLLLLFEYNYWATGQVLAAAAKISPEQWTASYPLSHGSLRGALVHMLSAEVVWRMRCQQGVSLTAMLADSEFPTLEGLQTYWSQEEQAMRSYISCLTDEAANQRIQYKTTKGVVFENTLWMILAHVVNHGTQFRAEAAVALTDYGASPGDLDLLAFYRARGMV
jgi:uncharacterized damage-inducible protein DinB